MLRQQNTEEMKKLLGGGLRLPAAHVRIELRVEDRRRTGRVLAHVRVELRVKRLRAHRRVPIVRLAATSAACLGTALARRNRYAPAASDESAATASSRTTAHLLSTARGGADAVVRKASTAMSCSAARNCGRRERLDDERRRDGQTAALLVQRRLARRSLALRLKAAKPGKSASRSSARAGDVGVIAPSLGNADVPLAKGARRGGSTAPSTLHIQKVK